MSRLWFPGVIVAILTLKGVVFVTIKGRHSDLEARAVAAFTAEVHIVWMKAHQTDRDADEGRVDRTDLHRNHMADVAANSGTREHVPL
eukprot:5599333-Amphidinium_carterae.1